MNFIDANVLAYAFYANSRVDACQKALRQGGVTDSFALAEAFYVIEKETGSRDIAVSAVKALLKLGIKVVPVDVNVVFESLKEVSKTKLSIFDAIHYACSSLSGCDSFLSYDRDFDNLGVRRTEP